MVNRSWLGVGGVVGLLLLASCSAKSGGDLGLGNIAPTSGDDGAKSGTGGTENVDALGTGGQGFIGNIEPGEAAPTQVCATETTFVYAISSENILYRFDPTVASRDALTPVGPLGCTPRPGPNSMSVGRDGFAQVAYWGQTLTGSEYYVFKVGITDGACAGFSTVQCGSAGFEKFGMGFVSDEAGSNEETLYLSEDLSTTPRLGRVDKASGEIIPVGGLPGAGEFTGNANGELWGFFPELDPPAVLQIDKTNGSVLRTLSLAGLPPVGAYGGAAFAFAFWGGAFYIFYERVPDDQSTNIWKLTMDGSLDMFIPNTGLRIVGAGVSTCAPVDQPR